MDSAEATWDMPGTTPPPQRWPWWKRVAVTLGAIVGLYVILQIVIAFFFASFTIPTSSMENTILVGDRIWVTRSNTPPERGEMVVFVYPGDRQQVVSDVDQRYLDRVVAIGGDTLEVRDGRARVNGAPEKSVTTLKVEGPFTDHPDDRMRTFPEGYGFTRNMWGPLRVPKKGDVIDLSDPDKRMAWEVFVRRDMLGNTPGVDRQAILSEGLPGSYTVRGDYYFVLGDNRNNSLDSRYWGFVPVTATVGRPYMIYMSIGDEEGFRGERMFRRVDE